MNFFSQFIICIPSLNSWFYVAYMFTNLKWNRAVNTALLDAYQLKSQDGVLEVAAQDMNFTKIDGKIYATLVDSPIGEIFDNFAARVPYDRLIRALGFTFDDSLFNKYATTQPILTSKYLLDILWYFLVH